MYKLRIQATLILTSITGVAAYLMQLFMGIYYQRDLMYTLSRLRIFNIIVITLLVGATLIYWRILAPLDKAAGAIEKGRSVSLGERKRATQAGFRVTLVILATIVVAYVLGPVGGIAGNMASGITSYTISEMALIMLVNLSVGAMAGTH